MSSGDGHEQFKSILVILYQLFPYVFEKAGNKIILRSQKDEVEAGNGYIFAGKVRIKFD